MKQLVFVLLLIALNAGNTVEKLQACQAVCEDQYSADIEACTSDNTCTIADNQFDTSKYENCVYKAAEGVGGCREWQVDLEKERSLDELSVEFAENFYNCYMGCANLMRTEVMTKNLQCQARCDSLNLRIDIFLGAILFVITMFI